MIFCVCDDEVPQWHHIFILDGSLAKRKEEKIRQMELGRITHLNFKVVLAVAVGKITDYLSGVLVLSRVFVSEHLLNHFTLLVAFFDILEQIVD